MNRRVVVTGLGVITPIGLCVRDFWHNLLEGKSGIDVITSFDAAKFPSRIGGEAKDFDPLKYFIPKEVKRVERFVQFAYAATKEAIEDAGLENDLSEFGERAGVLVGSGIGSLGTIEEQHKIYLEKGPSRISSFLIPKLIVNEAAGYISIRYKILGPNLCITTACATGSHAIGEAARYIKYGLSDIMIAGGTESSITPLGVGGFCALKALSTNNDNPKEASRPFDKNRDGFIISEGAGIVILEELEHAKRRKANIYAELAGYSATGDAYHITAPDPEAKGAALSILSAINKSELNPDQIDYINAHGTSTQLNDKMETLAIKKVFEKRAYDIDISSNKSMLGHLLGAAGGVEFIATCLTTKHNKIPPTINLKEKDPECDLDYVPNQMREKTVKNAITNSFGFGGHNASIVVKKF